MTTQNKQAIFKDHIYPVFAGGDDCFLVGAWDAVVEFGYLIYNEFKKFSKCKITLSCGIILVGSGFPVIRFAHLAEDALKEAKGYNQNGKTKNAVSLFGEVISWEDFEKVIAVKNILLQLIELGESRGVLDRIRQSGKGYFSIQEAAKRGYVSHDRIWRFNYYLRNIKTPEGKSLINNQLIPLYQKYLLNAITQKQYTDAAIFPLAARWAELLTRQITTKS